MRPAARLLLVERDAIRPVLEGARSEEFDLPTACVGWSIRDVLAHCAAALTRAASGDLHGFTPDDNQADVDERRGWTVAAVIDELYRGYEGAAVAIDRSGGRLDGIGLGEWIHGGDVREPLGAPDPYTSPGAGIARQLLVERSVTLGALHVTVVIDEDVFEFGTGDPVGNLTTDLETFVRLTSARNPDQERYRLGGVPVESLVLFS